MLSAHCIPKIKRQIKRYASSWTCICRVANFTAMKDINDFKFRFQVLYYKDFSPCLISRPSLNALTSIDWKSYGLTLRSYSDENSDALLEWENLPLGFHIDIVLHHYQKQYPSASDINQVTDQIHSLFYIKHYACHLICIFFIMYIVFLNMLPKS